MNTLWVMEIGDWRLEIFNRERRNIVQNPKTLQYLFSISFYNIIPTSWQRFPK